MEKIFDKDFREALIDTLEEAGVGEDNAATIVSSRYKEALKQAVISRLEEVISLIKEDKYKELSNLCSYSPAGDCMGCDNVYINFSDICDVEDIGDVIYKLDENINLKAW